jgi:hypothetical protein
MATSSPSQVQETQYGFAPQIAPYAENVLSSAQGLTDPNNPYMQYMGDRVAQYQPMQQQSYENAAMMQTSPQLQDATAMAGLAGMGALNTGFAYNPYTASQVNAGKSFTDPGVAQTFMNPYQQGVTDIAQRKAMEQAGIANTQRNAQATQGGAFGGSRQAIGNAAAASGLATQLGDIQAQGLNAAYGQGMQQYNTQQGANMQAQLANQQAQQAAANLNAQQGQYGAGLGLQGLQTAMTGANTLGTLGQTQYNQNMGINQLQNQLGAQQQQQVQTGLNNQYQDYINYQNQPYKQIGFMSDILRGTPLTQTSSTMYQAAPSAFSQVAGLGATALGAYGAAGGFKPNSEGGAIRAYAKGGLVRPAGLIELALASMR